MRIEMEVGLLRLERGQTLLVVDGADSTIRVGIGMVWITEEDWPSDVVLNAGASYRLRTGGVVFVEALGRASVSVEKGTVNPVYRHYRNDESFRAALHAAARRSRNAAIEGFIIAPLKALFTALQLHSRACCASAGRFFKALP